MTHLEVAKFAGLQSARLVSEMEQARRDPTLSEFFQLAYAFSETPETLFWNLITQWRSTGFEPEYQGSRGETSRVYRLGYFDGKGRFQELSRPYGSFEDAASAAAILNPRRRIKSLPLITTVLLYTRLASMKCVGDSGTEGE